MYSTLFCLLILFSVHFCKGSLGLIGVSGPKGQKGEDSVAKEKGDPLVLSALRASQKGEDYSVDTCVPLQDIRETQVILDFMGSREQLGNPAASGCLGFLGVQVFQ